MKIFKITNYVIACLRVFLCILALFASTNATQTLANDDFFNDNTTEEEVQIYSDPFEKFNRQSFKLLKLGNNLALIPLAKGYDYITPDTIQPHILSTLANIGTPLNIFNGFFIPQRNISIRQTSKFLTNTIFGLGGFFDIHSEYAKQEPRFSLEDVAQYYFKKPLPYLVLPIGFGNIFSIPAWVENQQMYMIAHGNGYQNAMIAYSAINVVATVNVNREQIEDALNNSLDPYSILRNVYYQSQLGKLQTIQTNEKPQNYTGLIHSDFM